MVTAIVKLAATLICYLSGTIIAPVIMSAIQDTLHTMTKDAFKVDKWIDSMTSTTVCEKVSAVFAGVGISLLLLIFVKKGFETYILYTDGDPDSNPFGMLSLFVKAMFVASCGTTILGWFGSIVSNLALKALNVVESTLGTNYQWSGLVDYFKSINNNSSFTLALTRFVLVSVFSILFWIVYIKCMTNGLELYILKIAMPLCAVGLINSDKGIFKNYVMSVAKCLMTILIQVVLTELGFSIMISAYRHDNLISGTFLGIICLSMALKGPKLLSDFMVPSQGGGQGMMKAYYSMNMVKSFLHK